MISFLAGHQCSGPLPELRVNMRGINGMKAESAMAEASKQIREFFDAYAKATASIDLAFFESAYGDTFMFASPGGVQAVKRDDFLKVVPKRAAFFRAAGLVGSEISRLEEMGLDETHTLIQTHWRLRFEKDPGRPIC